MKINPAPYCQRCQFYHGANQVVCGLHPYGPGSETCSDYAPKACGLNQSQTSRDRRNSRQSHDWKVWQQLLMLGMLAAIFGSGCLIGWLTTHYSIAPTTKTTTRTGLLR